jgi:hypothetical protein
VSTSRSTSVSTGQRRSGSGEGGALIVLSPALWIWKKATMMAIVANEEPGTRKMTGLRWCGRMSVYPGVRMSAPFREHRRLNRETSPPTSYQPSIRSPETKAMHLLGSDALYTLAGAPLCRVPCPAWPPQAARSWHTVRPSSARTPPARHFSWICISSIVDGDRRSEADGNLMVLPAGHGSNSGALPAGLRISNRSTNMDIHDAPTPQPFKRASGAYDTSWSPGRAGSAAARQVRVVQHTGGDGYPNFNAELMVEPVEAAVHAACFCRLVVLLCATVSPQVLCRLLETTCQRRCTNTWRGKKVGSRGCYQVFCVPPLPE